MGEQGCAGNFGEPAEKHPALGGVCYHEGMGDLGQMFYPKSVAVIGASRDESKIGGIVVRNIRDSGYTGQIYPVNPNAPDIQGLKCYTDYQSIPEVPELAVVALPAALVMEVLKQVGEKGTKQAVVFSAGFKEIGEEGKRLEEKMVQLCNEMEISMLGPNCLGFVNNLLPINVTFGQVVKNPGNLRFLSQSGAIASSIFDWFEANGLGFSEFVTLGNKAVVGENQVLEYWINGSKIKDQKSNNNRKEEIEELFGPGLSDVYPVGMYLESVVDGGRFLELVRETSKRDPVFVLKPGKSAAAVKAMQSHTGAIAGEDAVLETALRQAGVVRCEGIEDMFDLARAFAWEKAPAGPSVAVVSNAGGPAVISADAVQAEGLSLAVIDGQTHDKLLEHLPRAASIVNPVDVLGDALAQRYADAVEVLLADDKVQALVVILTPQVMTQIEETARLVGELAAKHGKPVVCSFMGGSHIRAGEEVLNKYRIPSFRFPERAIKALAAMWKWKKWQISQQEIGSGEELEIDTEKVKLLWSRVRGENRQVLDSSESSEVLSMAGIKVPNYRIVREKQEIFTFAEEQGWPVVLKISSSKILHKTESGGVVVGIDSGEELDREYELMLSRIEGMDPDTKASVRMMIQKQVEPGVEIICGVKRDANFGLVMMFGAGGTLAELVNDRNLHLLPISRSEAFELIERSRVYKLLAGFRGARPKEVDKLVELMMKLASLAEKSGQVEEMEINPVIVTENDAWAVDGKVLLEAINNE